MFTIRCCCDRIGVYKDIILYKERGFNMTRKPLYVLIASYKDSLKNREVYYWRKKRDAIKQIADLMEQPESLTKIELYREQDLNYEEVRIINL